MLKTRNTNHDLCGSRNILQILYYAIHKQPLPGHLNKSNDEKKPKKETKKKAGSKKVSFKSKKTRKVKQVLPEYLKAFEAILKKKLEIRLDDCLVVKRKSKTEMKQILNVTLERKLRSRNVYCAPATTKTAPKKPATKKAQKKKQRLNGTIARNIILKTCHIWVTWH